MGCVHAGMQDNAAFRWVDRGEIPGGHVEANRLPSASFVFRNIVNFNIVRTIDWLLAAEFA